MRKLCAVTAILILSALCFSPGISPEQVTEIHGSPAFYDNGGRLFHVRLSPSSEWQIPVPLGEMGQWLPAVAVAAEDGRFFQHVGIDALSLLRAAFQDIAHGRVVSGASTITAQVVRLSVSEREGRKRSVSTKIREFIMALKLERKLSKPRILECYLNLAPFGGNIRGVEAASRIYFGKTAAQISPGEACLLIGMLKGPSLFRPDTRPKSAMKRRNEIISLMERKRIFTHDTASRAYLEELPRRKFPLPSSAWHFTELAVSQNPEHPPRFDTTLDLPVQMKLEAILRQALGDLPQDVTLAAGITDNRTGSLIAWAGNARFSYSGSWVDCGLSPRSPGSTLKPFAYLSAIEQGILTPSTLLADTPGAFSGRAPRNFDLSYRGAVTARTALHESLNAPAVRVLRNAGSGRVLSLMRQAGFHHLTQPASHYGDSLILGGCEVTLLEQLEAYTFLASMGVHRKLRLLSDEPQTEEHLASDAGCWIVSDMLKYDGEFSGGLNLALKTGTSYGLRDAWACSWTPRYTVCVWCGKTDGSSWEGLIGARACTPLAVSIQRLLPRSGWYERPPSVSRRKVCSLSGKPPTALCPSVKMDWHVEDTTRSTPCEIHGIKSAVNLPAEFGAGKNTRLSIISPIPGASYFTAPFDTARKIPLKSEGSKGIVYWYVDGKYAGMSEAGQTFFHGIDDGEHVVSVLDSKGRTDAVRVKVFTPGKSQQEEKLF
ncbi:MAG: penicillin-binding protein 1C [Synergistaceae bacterium]|nr:penicillin-binding protein 1C [Synergistaceae bacterium]